MGDRCYIELTCRRKDVKKFEVAGYVQEDAIGTLAAVLGVHMVDEEGYADLDALPKVPYFGSHGDGGSYGPGQFASDGKDSVYCDTRFEHSQPVATIFADGSISRAEYEDGVKFWTFLNRVRRRFRAEPRGIARADTKLAFVTGQPDQAVRKPRRTKAHVRRAGK